MTSLPLFFFFVTTGGAPLSTGASVCMKQYTPACTLNATPTNQTCTGLAAKSNITTNAFVQYNDDVDDACGNLTVGQPVRGCIRAE